MRPELPYKIVREERCGRLLVATRDIRPGEILFTDTAGAVGPDTNPKAPNIDNVNFVGLLVQSVRARYEDLLLSMIWPAASLFELLQAPPVPGLPVSALRLAAVQSALPAGGGGPPRQGVSAAGPALPPPPHRGLGQVLSTLQRHYGAQGPLAQREQTQQ